VVLLYEALHIPCVPLALNSGAFWPRRSLSLRPGTIVVEFLDPIPPGLPKAEFLERLIGSIETASARLLVEARLKEPGLGQPVNL
jgi:1-acyl-sn-glycerol-3-phosphate acyltransferase